MGKGAKWRTSRGAVVLKLLVAQGLVVFFSSGKTKGVPLVWRHALRAEDCISLIGNELAQVLAVFVFKLRWLINADFTIQAGNPSKKLGTHALIGARNAAAFFIFFDFGVFPESIINSTKHVLINRE